MAYEFVTSTRNSVSRRRGATAVEFAFTAPILFILVMGAIEFSRANMLVHTASIAATEAARASIIPGATAAEVRSAGMQQLTAVGISEATFAINPPEILDDTTEVSVQLSIPVNMRNGYILPRVFLGRNVQKTVTLQREGKASDYNTETTPSDGIKGSMQGNGYGGLATAASGKGNSNSTASATGQANANANSAAANASGSSNSGSGSSNSGSGSSNSGSGSSNSGSSKSNASATGQANANANSAAANAGS